MKKINLKNILNKTFNKPKKLKVKEKKVKLKKNKKKKFKDQKKNSYSN